MGNMSGGMGNMSRVMGNMSGGMGGMSGGMGNMSGGMRNRRGRIRENKSIGSGDDANRLFVGGLSYETTDNALMQYFQNFGTVTHHNIVKFPDTGDSRGFGFVTFSNQMMVQNCLDLGPHNIQGKTVELRLVKDKDGKNKERASGGRDTQESRRSSQPRGGGGMSSAGGMGNMGVPPPVGNVGGGGGLGHVCSGGNWCGGGFGNTCGHDKKASAGMGMGNM